MVLAPWRASGIISERRAGGHAFSHAQIILPRPRSWALLIAPLTAHFFLRHRFTMTERKPSFDSPSTSAWLGLGLGLGLGVGVGLG